MSNEKLPTVPNGGDRPTNVDETAAEPVDPSHEIAPPTESEHVRLPNGARRSKTVVRKIKNYLNRTRRTRFSLASHRSRRGRAAQPGGDIGDGAYWVISSKILT
jgi:hypothetical protein